MSIWGKVVGGVAGFAMGGPLGALIGGIAGHMYDQKKAEDEALLSGGHGGADAQNEARQVAFTQAVIVLAAKMAKSDGAVSKDEILAFRRMFHVPPEDEAAVGKLFNEARKDATGYEPYAEQIAMMFTREPAVLEELLAALFHIAKAMHLDEPKKADPYEILGVKRSDSDADIKKAYRQLIRENHPDKLMAEGMPQEFIDLANEKMATINAAFDQVKKERKL